MAAQGQMTAPADGAASTFTVEAAPQRLVCQFFFGELTAAHRKADQLEAQGKNGSLLRARYQQLLSLDAGDYRELREAAADTVNELEICGRQIAELARGASSPEDRQRVFPQVAALLQRSDAALANGVHRLRTRLGPEAFWRVDRRIRRHVVPHMKVLPVSGSQPPPEWSR